MSAEIFHIIGAGRGGTSLLAGLFDAHPACTVVVEALSTPYLMDLPPLGDEADASLEARTRARIAAFLAACEEAASAAPTRVWAHKATTEHIYGLNDPPIVREAQSFDTLDAFADALAGSQIVFILRDGRTCVASKVRRTGQPLELAITRWKYSVTVLRRLRSLTPNLMLLKFEDLVAEPVAALERACAHVGLPFMPEMLNGTMSEKIRPDYRRKGIDQSVLRLPEGDRSWWPRIADELAELGYGDMRGAGSP